MLPRQMLSMGGFVRTRLVTIPPIVQTKIVEYSEDRIFLAIRPIDSPTTAGPFETGELGGSLYNIGIENPLEISAALHPLLVNQSWNALGDGALVNRIIIFEAYASGSAIISERTKPREDDDRRTAKSSPTCYRPVSLPLKRAV